MITRRFHPSIPVAFLFAFLAVSWSGAAMSFAADAGTAPVQIQPNEPRVQIRAEILKATPAGSSSA